MLNKKVILGSLIAGAFLLPAVAMAGVVDGRCDKCHTMHNSQNGATEGGGKPMLLKGDGCVGCHAVSTVDNDADGRGSLTTGIRAPQVDDTTGAAAVGGTSLSGGYFDITGDTRARHNVQNLTGETADACMGTFPGGDAQGIGLGSGTPNLSCENCHNASGGHHGSNGAYRLLNSVSLGADVGGTGAGNYGVGMERHLNTYDTTMSNKCADCHGDFHGAAAQGSMNNWIRHPTDITLGDADAAAQPYVYADNYDTAAVADPTVLDRLPLIEGGSAGSSDDTLMCLTCHYAHGGPNNDLLAFDMGGISAGNGTADGGCEVCHNYTASGQEGM
jgi:hypothetical protein